MTPDEIAADRAVIDAATSGPGPWTAPGYEVWAAFIAAARTGWPRALDALEEAQAGRDEAIREARLSREATGKARAEVERLRIEVKTKREALDNAHAVLPPCAVCGLRGEWRDDHGRCPDCSPGWRERWPHERP